MTEINERFKNILFGLEQIQNNLIIENWENFQLDFSKNFEYKNEIIQKIKSKTENKSGFYSIFKNQDCLYIGVGRPIWSRLKSHYYASQGKDKAKRWDEFFQKQKTELTIYWKEFSCVENHKIDDKVRLLIEAVLTEKYNPEFEK